MDVAGNLRSGTLGVCEAWEDSRGPLSLSLCRTLCCSKPLPPMIITWTLAIPKWTTLTLLREGHVRTSYLSHSLLSCHYSPWLFGYRYFWSSLNLALLSLKLLFPELVGPSDTSQVPMYPCQGTPRVAPMPQEQRMMSRTESLARVPFPHLQWDS